MQTYTLYLSKILVIKDNQVYRCSSCAIVSKTKQKILKMWDRDDMINH